MHGNISDMKTDVKGQEPDTLTLPSSRGLSEERGQTTSVAGTHARVEVS